MLGFNAFAQDTVPVADTAVAADAATADAVAADAATADAVAADAATADAATADAVAADAVAADAAAADAVAADAPVVDANVEAVNAEPSGVSGYEQPVATEEYSETFVNEVQNEGIPTSGFDLRAAITIPNYIGIGIDSAGGSAFLGSGFGLNIQLVYRGGRAGFGIEQQIAGLISAETSTVEEGYTPNEERYYEEGDCLFMGTTYLIAKEYAQIGENGLFTFTEGLGIAYGANLEGKRLFVTDSDLAFAFKFDIGFTYFILSKYGVGISLEYAGAIAIADGFSYSHVVTPLFTYQMIF
jgi:hypothetical protein